MSQDDPIASMLHGLKGDLPVGRENLSEDEKDLLIKKVGGVGTAKNIIASLKTSKKARIPFIFSSVDTQAVVDILANDMKAAIKRAGKDR